jgi:hypothetical protein
VALPAVKPPSKPTVPAAAGRPAPPQIDLGADPGADGGGSLEWLKWLAVLVLALATAFVTFHFLF